MIVIGIDPGLASTGWGVVEKQSREFVVREFGCITTSAQQTHAARLQSIHKELSQLIIQYKPDAISVEELFFAKNAKTAGKVGEARGVVLLTASLLSVLIYEYTPLQVKQAITGYGRAEKEQIQYMIKSLFKLKEIPQPDDAADALAVALTCLQSLSSPLHAYQKI